MVVSEVMGDEDSRQSDRKQNPESPQLPHPHRVSVVSRHLTGATGTRGPWTTAFPFSIRPPPSRRKPTVPSRPEKLAALKEDLSRRVPGGCPRGLLRGHGQRFPPLGGERGHGGRRWAGGGPDHDQPQHPGPGQGRCLGLLPVVWGWSTSGKRAWRCLFPSTPGTTGNAATTVRPNSSESPGRSLEAAGLRWLLYGYNASDHQDDRPGHRAALEAGALTPLSDAGLDQAGDPLPDAGGRPPPVGKAGQPLPELPNHDRNRDHPREASGRGGAGGHSCEGPASPPFGSVSAGMKRAPSSSGWRCRRRRWRRCWSAGRNSSRRAPSGDTVG